MPSAAAHIDKEIWLSTTSTSLKRLENVKPITVRCMHQLDEAKQSEIVQEKSENENEKSKDEQPTAAMITIVPSSKKQQYLKRRPSSVMSNPKLEQKKLTNRPQSASKLNFIDDMVTKPPTTLLVRHLAILPSSKQQQINHLPTAKRVNLSDTFTKADVPPPTPNVGLSFDTPIVNSNVQNIFIDMTQCMIAPRSSLETTVIIDEDTNHINIDENDDEFQNVDNLNNTNSTTCELIDHAKVLPQFQLIDRKPRSLINNRFAASDKSKLQCLSEAHVQSDYARDKISNLSKVTVCYGDENAISKNQQYAREFYQQLVKIKQDPAFKIESLPLSIPTKIEQKLNELENDNVNSEQNQIDEQKKSALKVTKTLEFINGEVKEKTEKIDLRVKSAPTKTSGRIIKEKTDDDIFHQKQFLLKLKEQPQRIMSAPPPQQTLSSTKIVKTRMNTNKKLPNNSNCENCVTKKPLVKTKPITTKQTTTYCRQRSASVQLDVPKTKSPTENHIAKDVINIHINGPEITLLPADEQTVQEMYHKLQQLQPDGVCVELNTLRRALYPPTVQNCLITNHNEEKSSVKRPPKHPPKRWTNADDELSNKYEVKLQNSQNGNCEEKSKRDEIERKKLENLDQIYQQVKKHAEINYSYYTRTNK
ncbi:unnamed protein product [Didymodactylos carnosus]|uniref:Uncharacterized protein n=1 Tax=Didymodactylos carnosus TaxID=1234261 RepID=A0A814BVT7_9BILA|nr:unnamed protein product [Didymodactylos carnosus]CAF0931818.1 unnamed protein product [Didymodactylos carnosus]CAF3520584.1 unnamed protein product [Didymodactylos carnosus]CAF3709680.1 unnamed protein product [Didymodactylos carnosus]